MALSSTVANAAPAKPQPGQEVTIPAFKDAQQRARKLNSPQRVIGSGSEFQTFQLREQEWQTCLDLADNRGPKILHWGCGTGDNQRWYLVSSGAHWEIRPYLFPGDCADVENVTGPKIIKYGCSGAPNQRWEWWTRGDISWFSPASNRETCLDAERNGPHALAWRCNGGANQHWKF